MKLTFLSSMLPLTLSGRWPALERLSIGGIRSSVWNILWRAAVAFANVSIRGPIAPSEKAPMMTAKSTVSRTPAVNSLSASSRDPSPNNCQHLSIIDLTGSQSVKAVDTKEHDGNHDRSGKLLFITRSLRSDEIIIVQFRQFLLRAECLGRANA